MFGTCPVDQAVWSIFLTLMCLFDVAVCGYTSGLVYINRVVSGVMRWAGAPSASCFCSYPSGFSRPFLWGAAKPALSFHQSKIAY